MSSNEVAVEERRNDTTTDTSDDDDDNLFNANLEDITSENRTFRKRDEKGIFRTISFVENYDWVVIDQEQAKFLIGAG